MRELFPLVMAAALGVAVVVSGNGPYEEAARQLQINHTTAAQILKVHASQEAMFEAQDRPTLPPGIAFVLPGNRGPAPGAAIAREPKLT